MKKMSTICAGVLMSLLVSLPALGGGSIKLKNGQPVVFEVLGAPVVICSRVNEYSVDCLINTNNTGSRVKLGETLRIKVIGDKDIIVQCNGEKGITISRE